MKELLNKLRAAIELAAHTPGKWAEARQSMGSITDAGPDTLARLNIGARENTWGHFEFKRDMWLAVAAVNALPELMAAAVPKLQPTHEWHEDFGACIFFHFHSFEEPPEVLCNWATSTDFDEQYWTHFVRNFDLNSVIEQAEKMAKLGETN